MQKQPVNLNILPKPQSYMTAQSMTLNLGICLFNRSESLGSSSQKQDQPAHSLCCRQTKPLTLFGQDSFHLYINHSVASTKVWACVLSGVYGVVLTSNKSKNKKVCEKSLHGMQCKGDMTLAWAAEHSGKFKKHLRTIWHHLPTQTP